MIRTFTSALVLATALGMTPTLAQNSTGGSAGTATTQGGQSASTLGVGATSDGTAALGMGASGATTDGTVKTRAAVHGNNNLNGQAMATARDGGDFARSHTTCHAGDDVSCRTKTMAHEPGSKPVKSTSSTPR
ncbi:MAG: hypothetical protein V4601_13190 [Pseudomonadota bacterium]